MTMVLNYMRALACSFAGSGAIPVIDTDGVSRSINFGGTFPVNALAGQDYFGLQVGSSGAEPVGSEYALGNPIAHGDGNGCLMYGTVTYTPTSVDGNSIQFACLRGFINMTPDPITIREVGLVARHSGYNILLSRDVIVPIEIPPYDGVTVTMIHRTVL